MMRKDFGQHEAGHSSYYHKDGIGNVRTSEHDRHQQRTQVMVPDHTHQPVVKIRLHEILLKSTPHSFLRTFLATISPQETLVPTGSNVTFLGATYFVPAVCDDRANQFFEKSCIRPMRPENARIRLPAGLASPELGCTGSCRDRAGLETIDHSSR